MRIFPFFIDHGGCPHRCAFCRQEASVGSISIPSPQDVSRELPRMLNGVTGGEVAFYGGTFTLLPESLQLGYLEAVAPFLQSGAIEGVRVSTRPDALSDHQLSFLKHHGVSTVEIGCQSFSSEVLARSHRGHGPESSLEAVARVQYYGIRAGIQLMPGLPGGDRQEALASLGRALGLKPAFLRIYPAVVLRGTQLASEYEAGLYVPLALEEAIDLCAEMLWHCQRFSVPVIRLGLQASDGLDRGEDLLAGPYHPAFGQMVRSRLWLRALRNLAGLGVDTIFVHRSDLADALGNKRFNIICLQQDFPQFTLRVHEQMTRGTITSALGTRSLYELSAYPTEEFSF